MLTLAPQEQGVFQAQTLVLWTDDGRQGRIPIRWWTVDVGQPPPERPLLQDQGIRVISTDTPQLPYDYDLAKGAKLLSVQVGPGQVHSVVRSGVDRTSGSRRPFRGMPSCSNIQAQIAGGGRRPHPGPSMA